jgi:hypothetical protein
MATVKDLQDLLAKSGIAPETVTLIITEARSVFGGDKIYFPPPNSRKDPERADAIRKAAARLPTGVVCQRFGVSRQLVAHHIKKGKNPAG